jgi:hypothetical protein
MKPYVISGELELLGNFVSPDQIEAFRTDLIEDLTKLGKDVVWVGADELVVGLNSLIKESLLPVVTLDDRYVDPNLIAGRIAISRSVDPALQDAGYDCRIGSAPLVDQLDIIGREFQGQDIALADDVLFSGGMVRWLAAELRARGVQVTTLLAGISIGEGTQVLGETGIDVRVVRFFSNADDQLCERDFTLVPGSGKKVAGQDQSALYFDPVYGNPEWASIPADAMQGFCVRSLQRALNLLPLDTRIESIGKFLGYETSGSIEDVVAMRLEEG